MNKSALQTIQILFLLIFFWVVAPFSFAADEHSLQGKWIAVSASSNGEPPPPGMLQKLVIIFDGDKVSIMGSSLTPYTINESVRPSRIDILNSHKQVGIFEFRDDKLHLCFGEYGDRPTAFHTEPHTDRTYIELKREKK